MKSIGLGLCCKILNALLLDLVVETLKIESMISYIVAKGCLNFLQVTNRRQHNGLMKLTLSSAQMITSVKVLLCEYPTGRIKTI